MINFIINYSIKDAIYVLSHIKNIKLLKMFFIQDFTLAEDETFHHFTNYVYKYFKKNNNRDFLHYYYNRRRLEKCQKKQLLLNMVKELNGHI